MEERIIQKALNALKEITGIQGTWEINLPGTSHASVWNADARVEFTIGQKRTQVYIWVKKEVRNYQLNLILQQKKGNLPLMIIADHIFPKIKEELRKADIGYLETNGNIYLRTGNQLIWIEKGKNSFKESTTQTRAFTKTGLKVLFLYLLDDLWINKPYREVAEQAGVALGAIPPVIRGLKMHGFLIKADEKDYRIVNKQDLIQKWVEAYGEKLKPKIKIGNFMMDVKTRKNWRSLEFNGPETLWSGEPAGDLLTNHLNPQHFTLYTTMSIRQLITEFHMLPQPNGEVEVYQMFWGTSEETQKTVPPLLVYADLMNTNDSRCIETANMIYDRYIRI